MRILTWEDFNFCINSISSACKNKQFTGVYGVPRGGLCLAVALSHSLGIPLLMEIRDGCLVVDDVYETGTTLKQVLNISAITTFVWFSKVPTKWWKAVEISDPDQWLVFPWENQESAIQDMKDYQFSRSET